MQAKFKVILPSGVSYDRSYGGSTLSIGRDPACEVTMDDSEGQHVSWMHARIECDGDTVLVRDFKSKNGTYVNEEPVDETRPIQIGDRIQLGRTGPTLIVLGLDADRKDAPPIAPSVAATSIPPGFLGYVMRRGLDKQRWIVAGALAAAFFLLLLLVGMVWFPHRGSETNPSTDQETKKDKDPSSAKTDDEVPPPPPPKKTEDKVPPPSPPKKTKDEPPLPPGKPTPPLTTEELKKRYSGAVVWLCAEFDQRRLPLCSGFAVDRTKIVCTAREIVQLKGYHQEGKPILVYCETCSPKFLRVVDLKVHPAYDQKDPTSSASMLHNVGVAIVESPLNGSVDLLPSRELPKPLKDMKVTAAGYSIQYEPDLKPYDPLDPPKQVWREGHVIGTKTFPGGGEELPLLELAISAADGTDGGPVFSGTGKVIGVLLRYGEQRYVVLSDQLSDLIR